MGHVEPQSGCVSYSVLNRVHRRVRGYALESKEDDNVNAMTGDWGSLNVMIAT